MAVDKKLSQFLVRKLAGVGTGVVRYDLTLSQQLPLIDSNRPAEYMGTRNVAPGLSFWDGCYLK